MGLLIIIGSLMLISYSKYVDGKALQSFEEKIEKKEVISKVNPGDEIEAKILNFQPEEKRMLISIKEVNAEPEEDYTQFMKPEESLGATIGDAMKKSEK